MKSKGKIVPAGEIRQSQMLTTFGPGAMVDLPNYSVIISGLSDWKGERKYIREDRLRAKVADLLQIPDIKLYTPPRKSSEPDAVPSGVDAFVFPSWFLVNIDKTIEVDKKEYRTRPFIRWNAFKGKKVEFRGEKGLSTVPVRFVQACVNGHLDDIDWDAFVHTDSTSRCLGQLWLDEAGSGNDFEEIFVRCEECKKRRALAKAKLRSSKVLGTCRGKRPWLGVHAHEACMAYKRDDMGNIVESGDREYNRLLVRSASNAYFSQILNVISLPDSDEALRKAVDRFFDDQLQYAESVEEIKIFLRSPKFLELTQFDLNAVWAEIQRRKSTVPRETKSIKQVELEALLSCPEETGKEAISRDLMFDARTRNADKTPAQWSPYLSKVVLVHRLREVIAQIGFTRFEAAMTNIEGEIDDLVINVRRADLDTETTWIPAIENKGEGIFVAFSSEKIHEWLNREAVRERGRSLDQGFQNWLNSRGIPLNKAPFPGLPYIMLHSLSHLLITAVSLECGYAASSIKERIYANDAVGYGILLYTGTSGSEGTLGGLVEVGRSIEQHLQKALELGKLCSNDPVCAQHDPRNPEEDRHLHGAACHGCLLIAETSCERRNEFLDRALIVNTVEGVGAEFFPDDILL